MICTLALLFFSGVVLAGLQSQYFPWLNLAGIIMVGIVCLLARKALP
ncbi:MAG: hypothetical protein JXA79_05395 [Deltaproteobacteria bacterium]|jgi:ABC-type transport system involved in cytochrome c biogenesis permease subunit|nr:hypothetical protein [Deltaproteobacteria bacterium]